MRLIVPADSSAELLTSQGWKFVEQRGSVISSEGGPLKVDERERLEGAAGLAVALRGEVELEALATRDVDRHGPDLPGARVDRDERRRRVGLRAQDVLHRQLGAVLQARVDRRPHAQAAAPHLARAEGGNELVLDVAEEVRLADAGVDASGLQAERSSGGACVAGEGDVVRGVHRREDVVPPRLRDLGLVEGVVDGRRLGEAGEERRLREGEAARTPREVGLCGRLDPVGVIAVVHGVHVGTEDPILRLVPRQLDCETGLLDLAFEGPLARDVEVADELLRDRRAALGEGALLDVGDGGAEDALVVETAVLVEAPVLDRDRGLRHPGRHVAELQRLPVARRRDRSEERAVRREDERVLADVQRAERVQGTSRPDRGLTAERGRDGDRAGDRERQDEEAERDSVWKPMRLLALLTSEARVAWSVRDLADRGQSAGRAVQPLGPYRSARTQALAPQAPRAGLDRAALAARARRHGRDPHSTDHPIRGDQPGRGDEPRRRTRA